MTLTFKENKDTNIFVSTQIIETFKDHPNFFSLVIFTRGCNFNCFHCHNKNIVDNFPLIDDEEIIKTLKEMSETYLYDLIIICGGEPTIHGKKLVNFLEKLRSGIDLPIRLDTNGSNPSILKDLIKKQLIDGIGMDIKFPYWNFFNVDKEKQQKYEKVIGIPFTKKLQDDLLTSIDLVINELSSIYSLFRTIKYPLLEEKDFEEIKNFLKLKGWKGIYQVNEFKYLFY